jgi:hypothetical protein
MMKRLLLALGLLLTVLACPLQAQTAPAFSSLDVSLWPEYDRPEVLVIYRGVLAADTPLPASVEIRIPARVGQPAAVAYVDEGGQRFNQQYTTRLEDDWLIASFDLGTQGFQLEYYDTLPIDAAGQRSYEFTFVADASIDALKVEFQVPPTAQDFAVDPAADSVIQGDDGLAYHVVDAGSVAAGGSKSWTFSYLKNGSALTAAAVDTAGTGAPAASASQSGNASTVVGVFLVAFVALLAVGAGAFWLGRRTQPGWEEASPPPRQYKRRGSGRGSQTGRQLSPPAGRDQALFCSQCGAELRSDSSFCHRCGAAVRQP